MDNNFITFHRLLQLVSNEFIPVELLKEISTWNKIVKSPYGSSFYNAKVDWNYKEHNSLRISNHWNFSAKGKLHCQTTTPVPEGKWAIGQFDSELQKFNVVKIVNPTKTKCIKTFYVNYYLLDYSYKNAVSNNLNYVKEIEKNFQIRYYRLLERFSVNPSKLPI